MIDVKFHAVFLPNHHQFNVSLKAGTKRFFEKMSIAKFLRFARSDKPLKIDGMTIEFNGAGGPEIEQKVRAYLKQVADAYIAAKYKDKIRNN